MAGKDKVLEQILRATSDSSIRFDGLCQLLRRLGFDERIRGSHHIFRKAGVEERIDIQSDGQNAKAYQVRHTQGDRPIPSRSQRIAHKFEVIIWWSDEDKCFVAEVPELAGCMAHGETPQAAPDSAQEAIQLWIDTAKEFGDPIPEPKGGRLKFA